MELMRLGGPMMWPLLAVSIAALAIILERFWAVIAYRVPRGITTHSSRTQVIEAASKLEPLSAFVQELRSEAPNEDMLAMEGQSVVADMEKRLGLLAMLAKCATLMGLLGTILGMIETFSVIADTTSGIDMSLLARGLWQALITTAAGLIIAIPSYIALALLEGRAQAMAQFLSLAANICTQTEKRSTP